jgi:uncharacterized protein (DUF488 family)
VSEIFTVGHSNHPIDYFVGLLRRHGVTALADVRSTPYSRRHPQFRRESLAESLKQAGIAYVFLGEELGGKRAGGLATAAQAPAFQAGLRRLREGAQRYRVAFMCAEREPLDCHRTILVARHLRRPDVTIRHILADGTLEEHESVERRLVESEKTAPPPLIATEPGAWREAVERAYDARGAAWGTPK